MLRTILIAALLCLAQSGQANAAAPYQAGLRQIKANGDSPFPIAIWYPATQAGTDGTAAPGRFPLILLSHGSGGSEMGHRDWAEYLAQQGFVVAAPRHWGDSYDQPDGRGSDIQLTGRAWQAKATLDTVLADPQLAAGIDASRIGMAGFSAGGYTTLLMAGARPDFKRWSQHCGLHAAEDDEFCPALVWRALPVITRPQWRLPEETRIKAAVVMAPAAILFDRKGLSGVNIPLRLYGASHDSNVVNRWNVDQVAANLPTPLPVNLVPGGHYVFLAPCDSGLRQRLPFLCEDAAGVDRLAIHRQLGEEMATFFGEHLK